MTSVAAPVMLRHGRVELALHTLRTSPTGRALLLLHGLGEQSPSEVPDEVADWPGSIFALDFSGHGASTVAAGGGYSCEVLMGDVDTAIHHLGPATVLGRGLGGYVALLAAGARPTLVRGVVITDGPGLAGGGVRPGSHSIVLPVRPQTQTTPDPYALLELGSDVRPPDYATSFVRSATQSSGLEDPVIVSAVLRPPWLNGVANEYGVRTMELPAAIAHFAALLARH